MLVLRGFIDESYDAAPVPKVFNLTCLVTFDHVWPWFERAWVNILDKKNAELKRQSRPQLSRYHAADCSSLRGEFAGWTVEEQIEFSIKLFEVFRNHPVYIHALDMPLELLVQEIPEASANPVGFAYGMLLRMVMYEICDGTLQIYPNHQIALYHDRCAYDGALGDAFRHILEDQSFQYRDRFLSIASKSWNNCVMLQAADMIAYENFKEGMQRYYPNPKVKGRRKSLSALLDLDSISGRAQSFGIESIRELKAYLNGIDGLTRRRLFDAARIHHE